MEVDMVAGMEVDMVAVMDLDKVADMEFDTILTRFHGVWLIGPKLF